MSSLNKDVLVLNKVWLPIRVIPAVRALTLVFADKASAIDVRDWSAYSWELWTDPDRDTPKTSYGTIITSSCDVEVPEIIVLSRYDKVFRKKARLTKRNIRLRDGGVCQYTGKKMKDSEADVDHVNPRSHGGQNSWDNMVYCSKDVNRKKADRTPEQAGLKLIRKPKMPQADKLVFDPRTKIQESWSKFLKVEA